MYITEVTKRTPNEYGFFAGPRITAENWKEAEKKAHEQGVVLVGELG